MKTYLFLPESRDTFTLVITEDHPLTKKGISDILISVANDLRKDESNNESEHNSNLGKNAFWKNNNSLDDTRLPERLELPEEFEPAFFEEECSDISNENSEIRRASLPNSKLLLPDDKQAPAAPEGQEITPVPRD